MKRRLVLSAAAAFTTGALAAGAVRQLPLATSLRDELAAAINAKSPLLVMVSLNGCVHCAVVREQHLVPLQAQGGPRIVQVDMRSDKPLLDFAGQARTHDQLVRAWGVKAAPTLLFFGQDGREVAPRLRGASIPDFYGAYLEERIQIARRELGR